jgi:cytochrome b subunit of formate dehydrogenase
VCIDCHSSHRVLDPREDETRHRFPESCGDCHGEAYSTYRDSFHGKATDLGFLTAAICSDCHTPHQNLPAVDPRSSIHPDRLQETCGRCHGEVSAAFVSFEPHSDPADPEGNRAVHVIWLLMTSLLIAVFGFFGLHDLLWLQRTVVGVMRGEIQRQRGAPKGPHVRRFTSRQIALHITIVVTFLLLAATGLPLKFHFAGWAKQLASLLGGVSMAGSLHRLAALATFGYFLFHLADLTRRALVDKEPGLLWGWSSMVPNGKDLEDLWKHLRYFLYLGERPRFDRFTYWEKFDYFAVFWGVVIIGASGLMLWFPGLFTQFLPGWALNVAFVVHSDEALLAVVFIFVFHFFHTHLRPESFPLDPVVFVGSVPLERFKEERPLEYERMKASGELSQLLVPAPEAERMRTVRLFGFTAVAVGLLLALGILWALLAH